MKIQHTTLVVRSYIHTKRKEVKMGRNKIIELKTNRLDPEDFAGESTFYFDDETFLGTVATRVDGKTNRAEDIEWLINHLPKEFIEIDKEDESITFLTGFKQAYFKPIYKLFKTIAKGIDLDTFAGCSDVMRDETMYALERVVNGKDQIVIHGDFGNDSLDEFIRNLEINTKYYIGGTVIYHY